jgi:hypothetical protein
MSELDLIGAKKVGWSASGNLVTGNKLKQVSIQADFPRAETYCLEFNKFSSNLNSNFPIRAEAFIKWSVEGNSVSRRVSLVNGITIQGVAQAVNVVIKDITFAASPAPISYDVSVQVTPGTRGSNKFPPFLSPQDGFNSLTPGIPTANIIVPQDAGAISLLIEACGVGGGGPFDFKPIPPGTLFVQMLQNLTIISVSEWSGSSEIVPIIPGTDMIRLSSDFAAAPGLASIQTTTILGIDG